jgi:elongation factor P
VEVDTSQFRNGLRFILDGQPFVMTYFQHVKPGKGGAFVRTKVKNPERKVLRAQLPLR